MAIRSWTHNLFARPVTRTIRKAPQRSRLALEALEDRLVPSTFTVMNTADSGTGSLRDAISQANAAAGADTINFDSGVFGSPQTIALTTGYLALSDTTGATTITGPAAGVTVNAGGHSRVFYVAANVTASLSGLTLTGGNNNDLTGGGGLWNDGTANLTNCTITGNSTTNLVGGGGLYNRGTATLTNCTVSNNTASQPGGGGVLTVSAAGSTTILNSSITGNQGSGGGWGGGILGEINATTVLTNSTISGNSINNGGGGVAVLDSATATLTNCTISGNSTTSANFGRGGGLYTFNGTANLTNCTISGNSTTNPGGGGLYNHGTATLTDTVVAGNTNASGAADIAGPSAVTGSFNLLGTGGSGGLTNGVNGNIVLTSLANLGLAPLGTYGGPTKTMALLPGSAAINAGTSGVGIPTTDQRGQGRVGTTDMGAVESQGYTLTATGGTPQTAVAGMAFASPLVVAVSTNYANDPVNGGVVTFTAPASGASAALSSSSPTIASGSASVTATSNGTLGAYTVTATASGAPAAVSFSLANVEAPSLVVNATSDTVNPYDGVTSLREAIAYAESLAGNHTVTFNPAVFGTAKTITLTSGRLDLTKAVGVTGSLTVQGPGANLLSINGNNASSVFFLGSGRTATLAGLTITGGKAGRGGGLNNHGTVTLNNCTLSGNSASFGGALANYHGTATLNRCTVSGNSAVNGGGLYTFKGAVTLTNSTVSGNAAANGGGLGSAGGAVRLINSTVSGNASTNRGGGLYLYGGTATLSDCTISGNSATQGGGLSSYLTSSATLSNCTVSGNSATNGGGMENDRGALTLGNTIVAKNTASSRGPDALGTIASQGNNLIGATDGSTGWVASDLTGTVALPQNPLLAPLANYGGPTQTMSLLPGSRAIDAGNNALLPTGVATDQRGLPRIVTSMVDIGALESSGFAIAVTSGSGQTTGVGTAFSAPLVATVTANNPKEPVAGGLVTFTPPPFGQSASLSGSPATIHDGGTARVSATANNSAGSYTVSATASGIATPASFSLTNAPSPFDFLVTGFPSSITAGVAHTFTVKAQNFNGTIATGYTGTVHFTNTDGQAVLPSDYVFTVADHGVHSFTATLKTAGSQSLTVTDQALSTLNGTEAGITVNPAALSKFAVSGFGSPTVAGTAQSFTVTAQDKFGNTVPTYLGTVTFTSSDHQAVLPAPYTFTAADLGTQTFSATLKTVLGAGQSITATDTNHITGKQTGIQVTPDAAAKFVVSGFLSPATAGTSHSFTVTVKDAYGNTATGYTGTVHFSSSDTKAVLPAAYTFTAANAGVKSFSATLKTAGTQTITAQDTVTVGITGTQPNITINPAAASHFQVVAPASVTAGTAFTITVTALDPFGNVATGYTGTVHFTTSDPSAGVILPANYPFTAADAGVHSFTNGVTLQTPGTRTITATDTVTSTIKGVASVLVTSPGTHGPNAILPPRLPAAANPGFDGQAAPARLLPTAADQVMALDFGPASPPHSEWATDPMEWMLSLSRDRRGAEPNWWQEPLLALGST
jgi:parallel beta-helix repeat protein